MISSAANSSDFETITLKTDGPLAFITMNRPDKHNAINLKMLYELRVAVQTAEAHSRVRLMILVGAGGKSFSSGIDLAGGILDEPDGITASMLQTLVPLLECMEQASKPIIACVEGAAIGLGCSLALQCDLLAMSEQATLNLAFSKLGLIADGGINWHLPRKVGYNRALQMVLEAQVLDAGRCLELGIANKVMATESVLKDVTDWALKLSDCSGLATGFSKKLMSGAMAGDTLLATVNEEAKMQAACAETNYFKNIYARILAS